MARVVCLSDTHGRHEALEVPEGDLLVHAGDVTRHGTEAEVVAFAAWLRALPHPHKVVVGGNHDRYLERHPDEARRLLAPASYLVDEGVTAAGLSVWGSPFQPWFLWGAFNLPRGARLRARWGLVPEGLDVLVTHSPPWGIADRVSWLPPLALSYLLGQRGRAGCRDLAARLPHVRPRLHVFGHIHEGYGRTERDGTIHVNASSVDTSYRPVNAPVVVEVTPRGTSTRRPPGGGPGRPSGAPSASG